MTTVLILAYDFPPNPSVGAKRPQAWFKYFNEFGIKPVVVTRHWDRPIKEGDDTVKPSISQVMKIEETSEGTVISVPFQPNLRDRLLLKYGRAKFSLFRKGLSLVNYLGALYHASFDEKIGLLSAAEKYIHENKVDGIIATGEPFILFRYACLLSKRHDIPWVADYRDGWTTNYNISIAGKAKKLVYRKLVQSRERKFVSTASAVTTISRKLAIDLEKLHGKKVEVISNGYDEETVAEVLMRPIPTKSRFSLAYSGTLYPYQRLETFLSAFKRFMKQRRLSPDDVQVNFYGTAHYPGNAERVRNYDDVLLPYLNITGRMPYDKLLEKLVEDHLCLVFANEKIDGSVAKIFDYLALRKPILVSVNDHGTIEDIIQDTQGGILCENEEEVLQVLNEKYDEFLEYGKCESHTINEKKYTRKASVEKLAKLINDLCVE